MPEEFITEQEPEFHGDREWYVKELRDRLRHFYGQINGSYSFPNSLEGDLLRMTWKLLLLSGENDSELTFYKKENEMKVLESIVEQEKEGNYFRIDLEVKPEDLVRDQQMLEESLQYRPNLEFIEKTLGTTSENEIPPVSLEQAVFKIIHLVFIDKKTFKEIRTPLAYYIGGDSKEVLKEEQKLILELNTRLYNTIQSD